MAKTTAASSTMGVHFIVSMVLSVFTLFMACGCQTTRPDTNQKVAQLSADLEEANQKIEEIYHRLSVVQFMVDNHERVISNRDHTLNKSGFKGSPYKRPSSSPEPDKADDAKPVVTEEDIQGEKPADSKPEEINLKGSPEDIYNAGMTAFKAGDNVKAMTLFKNLVVAYPAHDLADNAIYWTGEIYYSQKDYQEAIRIFTRLVEGYPEGGKVPDALLKIGFSYHSLNDKANAVKYLKHVVVDYPFTAPGGKAEEMLNKIERKP